MVEGRGPGVPNRTRHWPLTGLLRERLGRTAMAVAVLDRNKQPLMPCSEKRARQLLERGRARVHRLVPFAIRLVDRTVADSTFQPVRLKLDPGSRATGAAVVREAQNEAEVQHLAEIQHRTDISERICARSGKRRRRRSANLRYRAPRFLNRRRPKGWLPPSLRSRVEAVESWVQRYRRLFPLTAISVETVRFDMQALENPEVQGVEYQQGELAGYEVREYLLEKFRRTCVYCGVQNVPLNIEHVHPRARGGSNRVSNLAIACVPCNEAKGSTPVEAFLAGRPAVLARIQKQLKTPLRDAAAVNSTRWALYERLCGMGLPVEVGTGGRTKFNRKRLCLPKTHALDALCVGASTAERVRGAGAPVLGIRCKGRGLYQRVLSDRYGFPRGHRMRQARVHGFATGDRVRAQVPRGKYAGVYPDAEVRVRSSGYFDLFGPAGKLAQGISYKHCALRSRFDGYVYKLNHGAAIPPATDSLRECSRGLLAIT